MSSKLHKKKSNSFHELMGLALFLALPSFSLNAETYNSKIVQKMLNSPYVSWGIDAKKLPTQTSFTLFSKKSTKVEPTINIEEALKIFTKNKDIVVGVIDTGIKIDHEFIKDNIVDKDGKKASSKNYGLDFSQLSKNKKILVSSTPEDTHGHGTHVSGIIKSIFPDVKLLPLKYYNPKASGQENLNATLKALRAAIDANVDIINYSGGGPEECKEEKALLEEAQRKGILIVAAAGNESSNIDAGKANTYYPASYNISNIISVAAYNYNGKNLELIQSSNYGSQSVDIAAPGFRILSSSNNDKDVMTGTSQATAFVTGVAALIKSMYPNLKPEEIKNIIISSAPEVEAFKQKMVSSGKLDAYAALAKAASVGKALVAERNLSEVTANKSKTLLKN